MDQQSLDNYFRQEEIEEYEWCLNLMYEIYDEVNDKDMSAIELTNRFKDKYIDNK